MTKLSQTFLALIGSGVCVFSGLAVLLSASNASATVTTVAWYRLGENDPGAIAGNVGNNPTEDHGPNNFDLAQTGTPSYSANTGNAHSTFSMAFVPANADLYSTAPVTSAVDNFGIEAWVRPDSAANALIAYNGNAGASGAGLYQFGGNWITLIGGLSFGLSTPVVTGTWSHLAMVRSGGTMSLYVNGVQVATGNTTTPNVPAGSFAVGRNGGDAFSGLIDEPRVFTFAAGQFQVSDLLFTSLPEPSSSMLFSFGVIGLLAAHRRRKV